MVDGYVAGGTEITTCRRNFPDQFLDRLTEKAANALARIKDYTNATLLMSYCLGVWKDARHRNKLQTCLKKTCAEFSAALMEQNERRTDEYVALLHQKFDQKLEEAIVMTHKVADAQWQDIVKELQEELETSKIIALQGRHEHQLEELRQQDKNPKPPTVNEGAGNSSSVPVKVSLVQPTGISAH